MSAPRCCRPGCTRQVGRAVGRTAPPKRGWRVVDGLRWAWFCSRGCASAEARSHVTAERMHHGHQVWRRLNTERRFNEMVQTLKGAMGPDGRVDAKALAKFIVDRERAAYRRGAAAMHQRFRRESVQASRSLSMEA